MKPVIFFVDDEPLNLKVFSDLCPKDWDVSTYRNPVDAVKDLEQKKPWVIVSDSRMPTMRGFEFLGICRSILPESIRMIVTGYSDEALIISAIRQAQITDMIKKPWDEKELLTRISAAIEQYKSKDEAKRLRIELEISQRQLKEKNTNLTHTVQELTLLRHRHDQIQRELAQWVPPFIVSAIETGFMPDRVERCIAGIVFDIKDSASLTGSFYNEKPIRNHVIRQFTETLVSERGYRESVSGDSSYGHFGLMSNHDSPIESAFSAALSFMSAVGSLSQISGIKIEVGVGLHYTTESRIHVHTTHFQTKDGSSSAQKSFDTSSADTDLLHRIEKLAHLLPGSNIVMTHQFISSFKSKPEGVVFVGNKHFTGIVAPIGIYLLPQTPLSPDEIEAFATKIAATVKA
jgi:FixJ family two-component response regulator